MSDYEYWTFIICCDLSAYYADDISVAATAGCAYCYVVASVISIYTVYHALHCDNRDTLAVNTHRDRQRQRQTNIQTL